MDRETLLKSLAGTLDADPMVRKSSEQALHEFEKQPGFTAYCLDLSMEDSSLGIKISAAIFFKNRIQRYWLKAANKTAPVGTINDDEKEQIKTQLVQAIIKNYNNTQLRSQYTAALSQILSFSKWHELLGISLQLLSQIDNIAYVYAGLLCLYELTKSYRWGVDETQDALNNLVTQTFPVLESIATTLVERDDLQTGEMLNLIIKIFKFATYSSLPNFFDDPNKLGSWCQLQLSIVQRSPPKDVMDIDIESRYKDPRIKVRKWSFANLHRLIGRYGGGISSKDTAPEFVQFFNDHFVPEILNNYWTIIEKWSTKQLWLSEDSIYYLISFLEQTIYTKSWSLVEPKFDAILHHIIFPSLNASTESIQLFEEDPDEYIRRYFDLNREGNTADVASTNFLYYLMNKKFSSVINPVLGVLNTIFNARIADRTNSDIAIQTEGALRVLGTISIKLNTKNSPVVGQIDKVLDTFVSPELNDSNFPFLAARACETISTFSYKYKDESVLSNIFQGVIRCFQDDEHLPVQLEAADALRVLIQEEKVAEILSPQVPQLMEKLLVMTTKVESDILTSVMEAFVEKFAKQLEPFAADLAANLSQQFMKLASEILESQSAQNDANSYDIDKEYQAAGVLSTLTTMVISMNSSPEVTSSLETQLAPLINFVLDNALVSFLSETLEIMESILFATKVVSPTLWELFKVCIESFQTYANEYFDTFTAFFESIVIHGFKDLDTSSPYVQTLIDTCLNVATTYDESDPTNIVLAFGLIEMIILALGKKIEPVLPDILSTCFNLFIKLQDDGIVDDYAIDIVSFIKIFLSSLYVSPLITLSYLTTNNLLLKFFELWFNNAEDLVTVYGLKIEVLSLISIISSNELPNEIQQSFGQLSNKLIVSIEQLPKAIERRNEILEKETSYKLYNVGDEDEEEDAEQQADGDFEDYENEQEEIDATRETPLDSINVFFQFSEMVKSLKQSNNERYNLFMGSLSAEKVDTVNTVVRISEMNQS